MRVIIKSNGIFYECQQKSEYLFKCGKCGRGNVAGQKGIVCRVCGAVVAQAIGKDDFMLETIGSITNKFSGCKKLHQ